MPISILIRSLGRTQYLVQALQSVALQKMPDLEVIVISAVPNHAPLPESDMHQTQRLVTSDRPLSRSVAANRALDQATGDWLLFLDDDDWLLAGHLSGLLQALNDHPEAMAAYSDVQLCNAQGESRETVFSLEFDPIQLQSGNLIPLHSVLFRREVVLSGCRFDETLDLYEDWDFWLQVAQYGTFIHVPQMTACYRVHDSSGVHQLAPFFNHHAQRIYNKWSQRWSLEQCSAIMERVWRYQEFRDQFLHAQNRLNASQEKMLESESRLSASQEKLRQIEDELAQAQTRAHDLQVRVNMQKSMHDKELEDLYASTSWRITAPLRALKLIGRVLWRAAREPGWARRAGFRGWNVLHDRGFSGLSAEICKAKLQPPEVDYAKWIAMNEPRSGDYALMYAQLSDWHKTPLISVVMPTYRSNLSYLQAAIDSVRNQVYPHWELCIADDASNSPELDEFLADQAISESRIRWIKRSVNGHISAASNSALALARGEFVALLDHDDLLHPLALWFMAHALASHPDAGIIYSDEDKLNESGLRIDPYFKSDFNPDLMLAQNMISHLGGYRRELIVGLGGFREGYEGSQDYDLALRAITCLTPAQIIHIPRVLYHWRMIPGSTSVHVDEKPYALDSAKRAVRDHLQRLHLSGDVLSCPEALPHQRVKFECPLSQPLVSIIIHPQDCAHLLEGCVDSIFQKTTYPRYEVIVVDNGSTQQELLTLLEHLQTRGVRVLRDEGQFNFSTLNNGAAKRANGEFLCLMNHALEITTPDWLEEMVSQGARPGIGAVGARLWYPNGTLKHAGVVVGVRGLTDYPHRGLPHGHAGYFGRAVLQQSWSAVTAECLLVRKSIFEQVGGLDETLPMAFNDVDFCLRLQSAGYRNVWTPYAEMTRFELSDRRSEKNLEQEKFYQEEMAAMLARWPEIIHNDPACSPNLSLRGGNFYPAEIVRYPLIPLAPMSDLR